MRGNEAICKGISLGLSNWADRVVWLVEGDGWEAADGLKGLLLLAGLGLFGEVGLDVGMKKGLVIQEATFGSRMSRE